jgi:hypothetical protein
VDEWSGSPAAAQQIHSALCRDGRTEKKFNLMGVGELRTYLSFTHIGDQPSL